ncbi:hypothetical protein [Bradyrhizobium sp. DOA9]|uniref:hypothetical protein n=1 Tax=Bradyrhizobium sp. DOA9 TaxID=1126627 RepID=UPI000B23119B|nr:hypothetical protein [Bradyrhizobium sp. DOA9]
MDDQVENLRFHGNRNLLAAQLAPVGVEKVVLEQKLHVETQASLLKSGKTNKMKFGSKTRMSAEGAVWFIAIA